MTGTRRCCHSCCQSWSRRRPTSALG